MAEKQNPSLLCQVKCNSNFFDNELSDSDVEIPLNPEISNTREQSHIITNEPIFGQRKVLQKARVEK